MDGHSSILSINHLDRHITPTQNYIPHKHRIYNTYHDGKGVISGNKMASQTTDWARPRHTKTKTEVR